MGGCIFCLLCRRAALRLARFNTNVGVVDKSFFQGLPSPAAAALVAGFVWLAADQRIPVNAAWLPWLALVITVYAGLTMVCNAPFYSGKSFHSGKSVPFWVLIAAVVVLFIVANDPALVVFCPFLLLRTQRIYLPVLSFGTQGKIIRSDPKKMRSN